MKSAEQPGLLPPVAISFAAGCILGVWAFDTCLVAVPALHAGVAAALLLAMACGLGLFVLFAKCPPRAMRAALACCSLCGGAGFALAQCAQHEAKAAAARAADGKVVEVEGLVRSAGVPLAPGADLLARFLRPPQGSWMEVESTADGGRFRVLFDSGAPPPGAFVRVMGWFRAPNPPDNPGGFDACGWARSSGLVGFVDCRGGPAPVTLPAPPGLRARSALLDLRGRVSEALADSMPTWAGARAGALACAMVVGRNHEELPRIGRELAATGTSHLLAISGFNVAILLAAGSACAASGGRAARGLVMLVLAIAFALCVDAGVSATRAAATGIAASASMLLSRRWHADSIVSLAAILILCEAPWQACEAGFQLSFLVALSLARLGGPLGRAWVDRFPRLPRWPLLAIAQSTAAWLVALPILAAHFGTLPPWGIALTLLLGPLTAIIVVSGTVAAIVAPAWSALASAPAALAAAAAWCMERSASLASQLPLASVHVGSVAPPIAALLTCLVWWQVGAWAGRGDSRSGRRVRILGWCVALPAAFLSTLHATTEGLRLTVVSVGDGTCMLLEDSRHRLLFDCGGSAKDVGSQTILPALRGMGVRQLDAAIVSHPDLDHFVGLPEVYAGLEVDLLLLTDRFVREATARHDGPEAVALSRVGETRALRAGDELHIGSISMRVGHPSTARFARANDESLALRVTHPALPGALLLLGDCADEGIPHLMADQSWLLDDVACMELPHHGSWIPAARRLVDAVRPPLILQSTGGRRLEPDRWPGTLAFDHRRLVTARDGAVRVTWVEGQSAPAIERWSGNAWVDFSREAPAGGLPAEG